MRTHFFGLLIVLIALGGCASYHPIPMTPEAVHARLKPPDMNEIRLQADSFAHPLLKPLTFDDRDGLSPDEAAVLAVLVNPRLRAIRDRHGLAAAQLLQAGLLPNPEFSFDFGTPVGVNSQGKDNSFGLGLGWEITSLLARGARRDAARAHSSSVDLNIAWQEWQVAQSARLHTYCLILAGKRLKTARRAHAFFQGRLKDMKKAVALGVKTELDLSEVKAAERESALWALKAQSGFKRERIALNRALGFPSEKMIFLEENSIPQVRKDLSVKRLFQDAEDRRLDLRALKLGYQSQEARVRAEIRSQFPKIHLGLIGDRDNDNVRTLGLGLSIELPFFDRNQGHIALARAGRKQLFDEYTARAFETRADISRLVTAVRAVQEQLRSVGLSLSALKILVQNCRHAADAGQVDIFSCYPTEHDLYAKERKKIELEKKYIDFGIALEIASGHYGLVSDRGKKGRRAGRVVKKKEGVQ